MTGSKRQHSSVSYWRAANADEGFNALNDDAQQAEKDRSTKGVGCNGTVAALDVPGIALANGRSSGSSGDSHCYSGRWVTSGHGGSKGGDGGKGESSREAHVETLGE